MMPITNQSRQVNTASASSAPEALGHQARSLQPRRYERGELQIPVRVGLDTGTVTCRTQDFTPGGLRLVSESALPLVPGTALVFKFEFAQICYLTVSGQVVYSLSGSNGNGQIIGTRFVAIRDWEQIILLSALKELRETEASRQKSIVNIQLIQDSLALEAETLSMSPAQPPLIQAAIPSASPLATSSHITSPLTTTLDASPQTPKKRQSRKGTRFTPDPVWVQEMHRYLEDYRRAIWNSRLVQDTATGRLSLKQVRGWCIQFYPFIEYFPQFMATYLAKAPDYQSRSFLIDNLRVEKRHADQWIDMAAGFGVPKEELFITPIVPEVEALTHWMWSITNRGSFVEAVAATNYAIEGVTQGIASMVIKGFVKYHGREGIFLDKRAYAWMEAHSHYDDLHPFEALEIIKRHATTLEQQHKVRHAAQRSLQYLRIALEGCYSAYDKESYPRAEPGAANHFLSTVSD